MIMRIYANEIDLYASLTIRGKIARIDVTNWLTVDDDHVYSSELWRDSWILIDGDMHMVVELEVVRVAGNDRPLSVTLYYSPLIEAIKYGLYVSYAALIPEVEVEEESEEYEEQGNKRAITI